MGSFIAPPLSPHFKLKQTLSLRQQNTTISPAKPDRRQPWQLSRSSRTRTGHQHLKSPRSQCRQRARMNSRPASRRCSSSRRGRPIQESWAIRTAAAWVTGGSARAPMAAPGSLPGTSGACARSTTTALTELEKGLRWCCLLALFVIIMLSCTRDPLDTRFVCSIKSL